MPKFVGFPKIPRLRRGIIITEKIDGTNAQVHITDDGRIFAGSRNRWITPEDDNVGFAAWVKDNESELIRLGPGSHFGEWWGRGIQRNYGMSERKFSLFNTGRWSKADERPKCCDVVPLLGYYGEFNSQIVTDAVQDLRKNGSRCAPGFMNPEGVVVFISASRSLFKQTLEKDDEPKGCAA